MDNKDNQDKDIDKEIEEAEKQYSKQDLNPYAINKLHRIPYWVKALFLKYWFFGMIIFFVGMGLSVTGYDFVLIGGLIGGAVYDVVINKLLELMDSDANESKWFVMFRSKKFYSVFINVLYCLVLFLCASQLLNLLIIKLNLSNSWLFQEPLTQAIIFFVVDALLIGFKDLIVLIIKKCKKK